MTQSWVEVIQINSQPVVCGRLSTERGDKLRHVKWPGPHYPCHYLYFPACPDRSMGSLLTEIIQGREKDGFVTALGKAERSGGKERWGGESAWLSERCCTIKIKFTAGFRQICKLGGCRESWLGVWRTNWHPSSWDFWIIFYTYHYLNCLSSDGFGTRLSTVNSSELSWLVYCLSSSLSLKISKSPSPACTFSGKSKGKLSCMFVYSFKG